jgi:hypothetical protein
MEMMICAVRNRGDSSSTALAAAAIPVSAGTLHGILMCIYLARVMVGGDAITTGL